MPEIDPEIIIVRERSFWDQFYTIAPNMSKCGHCGPRRYHLQLRDGTRIHLSRQDRRARCAYCNQELFTNPTPEAK